MVRQRSMARRRFAFAARICTHLQAFKFAIYNLWPREHLDSRLYHNTLPLNVPHTTLQVRMPASARSIAGDEFRSGDSLRGSTSASSLIEFGVTALFCATSPTTSTTPLFDPAFVPPNPSPRFHLGLLECHEET